MQKLVNKSGYPVFIVLLFALVLASCAPVEKLKYVDDTAVEFC